MHVFLCLCGSHDCAEGLSKALCYVKIVVSTADCKKRTVIAVHQSEKLYARQQCTVYGTSVIDFGESRFRRYLIEMTTFSRSSTSLGFSICVWRSARTYLQGVSDYKY